MKQVPFPADPHQSLASKVLISRSVHPSLLDLLDDLRCREDSLNGFIPCTHASLGVLGSPWHPTLSDLCYDQSFVPSFASISLHNFAKARISRLFPKPIVASLDSRLYSLTARPQRALAVEVGVDQLCMRWCNGRIELASIWSEDQRSNGGKDPPR